MALHGINALKGALRDHAHGGWFASVSEAGPVVTTKQAYGHAFVVLAASSAVAAGVEGADALLAESLAISRDRFWDERESLVVDEWDAGWAHLDDYRGVNANMHTVEAYLAAGDVTGEAIWHERAARICGRVVEWARSHEWRIPEHFDKGWAPLLDFNRDEPAHPFRPYGATVGHGLEWSRLILATEATIPGAATEGFREAAIALYARAVADGWGSDGTPGFVYTTDWEGKPVVRERMHWVHAEALNAAEALFRVTGDPRYANHLEEWWSFAEDHFIDRVNGSWHHELDPALKPANAVWAGKPDVYHAYQAALLRDVPLVPSFATALAHIGGLE
jgi:mannose/cellobiose epimerase-like protein (N-acyl-D-glucosamine 2-epimerase family)